MNLEARVKDDDFASLVNYIIEINSRIQKIVWEEDILRSIDKYKALRSCLKSSNEHHVRTNTKLCKEFILEYVKWVARKTSSLVYWRFGKEETCSLGSPSYQNLNMIVLWN